MVFKPYDAPRKARCERCRLHFDLCICALIPRLDLPTRVVVLMHAGEANKPSNTGKLAHLCLPNSEIRLRGVIDQPLSLEGLMSEERETLLLYLSPDSVELTPEYVSSLKKPVTLLVPDGTWSQASRLGAKLSRTLGARHVKLKADRPSEYRLRTEHHPDGMATFEAIARSLGVLESLSVRTKMEEIFRLMVDRELYARGKLKAAEVYGGLPNT